ESRSSSSAYTKTPDHENGLGFYFAPKKSLDRQGVERSQIVVGLMVAEKSVDHQRPRLALVT
ncbi:hypothetical protein, partial [Pseudomonas sp. EL_65y_Pfl2_R95]|uniref:hypothetical protein n=1 Tax=Pseudomonas sp. EL_65y_Pfl2_R95 TaxID=3088698 RepID=UPI0030D7AE97